jgi:hypothetical protein
MAIGYEYNKVRANSGTAQFGGSVTFSIPNFGDFLKAKLPTIQVY